MCRRPAYRPPATGAAVQFVSLASLRDVLRRRAAAAQVAALSVNDRGVYFVAVVPLRSSEPDRNRSN